MGEKIGEGGFSRVFRGIWNEKTVAVKVLSKKLERNEVEEFRREARVLNELDHPNIVKFLGACEEPPMIVMEYYEKGKLTTLLHDYGYKVCTTCCLSVA